MERTECFETSAYKIRTPGNYPKENIQQANGTWTSQAMSSIMWNWKLFRNFRCHFYNNQPLMPILTQIDPVNTLASYLSKVNFVSFHLSLGLPSGLFPWSFPTKTPYVFLFSSFSKVSDNPQIFWKNNVTPFHKRENSFCWLANRCLIRPITMPPYTHSITLR
jgi:hypothetical protein